MSAILFATDLSPHADRALARAALLAGGQGVGLGVLHVVSRDLRSGPDYQAAVAQAMATLREEIADAALPPGLEVTPLPRGGEAGPAIVQAAKELGSRLVVLAAPHSDLLVQIFRASVLNHVVRHAPCPVLVVRRRANGAYRRIVVAVDLSQPSRQALETALRLLPGEAMAEVQLTLVHARVASMPPAEVAEQQARVDDMLAAALGRLAAEGRAVPATEVVVQPGSPEAVVAEAAARCQAELVVVGTMGLTGAANLLLGSTAEALVATLPCDVMAVRAED
jgi:nucleotide-binding universal stress UspA family protein